jgi:pimeloyl-ACP methyl ester carboxylesterase
VWLRGAARALMRQVLAAQGDRALFHIDFTACNGYTDGLQAASQVTCPAHLVLGQFDQMTNPKSTRAVAEALKAGVHTVPGGHHLMAECPDAVLHTLRAALRSPADAVATAGR